MGLGPRSLHGRQRLRRTDLVRLRLEDRVPPLISTSLHLNSELLGTVLEARVLVERWRRHCNTIRPHSSLGHRSPAPEAIQPWLKHPRLSHANWSRYPGQVSPSGRRVGRAAPRRPGPLPPHSAHGDADPPPVPKGCGHGRVSRRRLPQ